MNFKSRFLDFAPERILDLRGIRFEEWEPAVRALVQGMEKDESIVVLSDYDVQFEIQGFAAGCAAAIVVQHVGKGSRGWQTRIEGAGAKWLEKCIASF